MLPNQRLNTDRYRPSLRRNVQMAMNDTKETTCAYCGRARPETRDHVPPQNLFPKPRPSNMITVPCCEQCRDGWSDDDEYFRVAIVSAIGTHENPYAQEVYCALLRSISKPMKVGFASLVRESLMKVEVQTEAGLYLGVAPAIKVNKVRFDRVAQRIIRGLFFHEKGYPVPEGYEVGNRFYQFGFERMVKSLGNAPFAEQCVIGDSIFIYTFASCTDAPDCTVWLSVFFRGLPFIGYTTKPEEKSDRTLELDAG